MAGTMHTSVTHQSNPAYTDVLKTVLKNQIQLLIKQLKEEGEEEVLLLSASVKEGTLTHLAAGKGLDFLHMRKDVKTLFFDHCMQTSDESNTMLHERYAGLTPDCPSLHPLDNFHHTRDESASLLHWLEKGTPEKGSLKRKHAMTTCGDALPNVEPAISPTEKTYTELQNVKAIRLHQTVDANVSTNLINTEQNTANPAIMNTDSQVKLCGDNGDNFQISGLFSTLQCAADIPVPNVNLPINSSHDINSPLPNMQPTLYYPPVVTNTGMSSADSLIKNSQNALVESASNIATPNPSMPEIQQMITSDALQHHFDNEHATKTVNTEKTMNTVGKRRTQKLEMPSTLKGRKQRKAKKKQENDSADQDPKDSLLDSMVIGVNTEKIGNSTSNYSNVANKEVKMQSLLNKALTDVVVQKPNHSQPSPSTTPISLVNLAEVLISVGSNSNYQVVPVFSHNPSTAVNIPKSQPVAIELKDKDCKDKDKTKKTLSSKIKEITERIKKDETNKLQTMTVDIPSTTSLQNQAAVSLQNPSTASLQIPITCTSSLPHSVSASLQSFITTGLQQPTTTCLHNPVASSIPTPVTNNFHIPTTVSLQNPLAFCIQDIASDKLPSSVPTNSLLTDTLQNSVSSSLQNRVTPNIQHTVDNSQQNLVTKLPASETLPPPVPSAWTSLLNFETKTLPYMVKTVPLAGKPAIVDARVSVPVTSLSADSQYSEMSPLAESPSHSHDGDLTKLKDVSRASHRKPKLPRFNIGVASDDEDNGDSQRTKRKQSKRKSEKGTRKELLLVDDNKNNPTKTTESEVILNESSAGVSLPDKTESSPTLAAANSTENDILNLNVTIEDTDSSFAHFNLEELGDSILLNDNMSELPLINGGYSLSDNSNKTLIETVLKSSQKSGRRSPSSKRPLTSKSVIVSGSKQEKRWVQCKFCSQKFPDIEGLEHHLETADHVVKKYKCDLCGRKFAAARDAERHRRIHTGEKPFTCTKCNKPFSRKDNLKLHLRTQHPVEASPETAVAN